MVRMRRLTTTTIAVGLALSGGALLTFATAVRAEQVSNERDIVNLRLGQRIQVDDGTCPTGQIKEVMGAQLSNDGVVRRITCVPRQGARR